MSFNAFQSNGTKYITELIAAAIQNKSRTATVSGNFIIDEAIRIPSNFTLQLSNCHLRMADGCYSNMFVNEHHGTDVGKTVQGTDKNITIIGSETAVLDGGEYNGLSEKTHSKNGLPPIWKNNLILFTNVDGFKITGISCRNQRWWALNFIYCSNGYLGDIDFCANDTAIDTNGNVYHGLLRSKYSEVLVKNADGIDIRQGCHDITIENISGFTEDDTVAITGVDGGLERTFAVSGLSSDICNITVKNIRAAAYCTIVRLLNNDGIKLHDVCVDGVYDSVEKFPYFDIGLYAVRVGDPHLFGTRYATSEETYNISIDNVYGKGKYAVAIAGKMKDVTIGKIEGEHNLLLNECE